MHMCEVSSSSPGGIQLLRVKKPALVLVEVLEDLSDLGGWAVGLDWVEITDHAGEGVQIDGAIRCAVLGASAGGLLEARVEAHECQCTTELSQIHQATAVAIKAAEQDICRDEAGVGVHLSRAGAEARLQRLDTLGFIT